MRRSTDDRGQIITLSVHLRVHHDAREAARRVGPSATADSFRDPQAYTQRSVVTGTGGEHGGNGGLLAHDSRCGVVYLSTTHDTGQSVSEPVLATLGHYRDDDEEQVCAGQFSMSSRPIVRSLLLKDIANYINAIR